MRLAPYTYGIYLFHLIPLVKRVKNIIENKIQIIITGADNNIEACQALADAGKPFTVGFILKEAIFALGIGLLISILLNKFIEQPIVWIRKVYIPSKFCSYYNTHKNHLIRTNDNNRFKEE
jgi:hypothetical protein